jgi:hypothetical protein
LDCAAFVDLGNRPIVAAADWVGRIDDAGRIGIRVSWSRKIGEVTPKLPSTVLLFQTLGKAPVLVAVAVGQAAVAGQLGGSFWPTVTVVASPV